MEENPYKAPQAKGKAEPSPSRWWWPHILAWLIAAALLVEVAVAAVLYYLWKIGVIGPPLTD